MPSVRKTPKIGERSQVIPRPIPVYHFSPLGGEKFSYTAKSVCIDFADYRDSVPRLRAANSGHKFYRGGAHPTPDPYCTVTQSRPYFVHSETVSLPNAVLSRHAPNFRNRRFRKSPTLCTKTAKVENSHFCLRHSVRKSHLVHRVGDFRLCAEGVCDRRSPSLYAAEGSLKSRSEMRFFAKNFDH